MVILLCCWLLVIGYWLLLVVIVVIVLLLLLLLSYIKFFILPFLRSWIRWPSTIKALSLPSGEGKGEGEGEKEGEGEGEGEVLEEETGYFREKEQIGTEGKNRTI